MPFSILRSSIASADAEAIFCPSSKRSPLRSEVMQLSEQFNRRSPHAVLNRLLHSPVTGHEARFSRTVQVSYPALTGDHTASSSAELTRTLSLLVREGVRTVIIPLETDAQLHFFVTSVRGFLLDEDESDLDVTILLQHSNSFRPGSVPSTPIYSSSAQRPKESKPHDAGTSTSDMPLSFKYGVSGSARPNASVPDSASFFKEDAPSAPLDVPMSDASFSMNEEEDFFCSRPAAAHSDSFPSMEESDFSAAPSYSFPFMEDSDFSVAPSVPSVSSRPSVSRPADEEELDAILHELIFPDTRAESFHDMLLRLIDESGQKDAEVYKRANITRQLFSKIRSNRSYQPGKNTVLAFAFALHLTVEETSQLLASAGFAFSPSSRADRAVRMCMQRDIYDIGDVNELLFRLDLKGLGA